MSEETAIPQTIEKKVYLIGGKKFELKPLSLRQKQLAAPVQKKIIEGYQKLAQEQLQRERAEKKKDKIVSAEIAVRMLTAGISILDIEVQGDSFQKFLATILTPSGEDWKKENIELYSDTMLEIDETTQREVLQDFLFKPRVLKKDSPLSTSN